MNCYETIDVMDLALDGTIASQVRPEFDAHLDECGPCRTYFEQLGDTVRALRNLAPARESNPRRAELLERFVRRGQGEHPGAFGWPIRSHGADGADEPDA